MFRLAKARSTAKGRSGSGVGVGDALGNVVALIVALGTADLGVSEAPGETGVAVEVDVGLATNGAGTVCSGVGVGPPQPAAIKTPANSASIDSGNSLKTTNSQR
jgi:hypothetical protein